MKQHPLSAAFPSMSDDEIEALANDIRAHGQQEAGVIYEGMVLDGWHRYLACQIADIDFLSVEFDPENDPVALVKSRNLHRRHLTDSQRAAAIVACSEWAPSGRTSNQVGNIAHLAQKLSNQQMAREAYVSPRTIKDAKTAHAAGFGGAVRDGAISANKAAAIARTSDNPLSKARTKPKSITHSKTIEAKAEQDAIDKEAYGDFDPLAELEKQIAENKALQVTIDALFIDDTKAELARQISIRQGIETQLSREMTKAANLDKELRKFGRFMDDLRKATGKETKSQILAYISGIAA